MCKRTTCVIVTLVIVAGWMGSTAMGQVPDKNGLVLWLDASQDRHDRERRRRQSQPVE